MRNIFLQLCLCFSVLLSPLAHAEQDETSSNHSTLGDIAEYALPVAVKGVSLTATWIEVSSLMMITEAISFAFAAKVFYGAPIKTYLAVAYQSMNFNQFWLAKGHSTPRFSDRLEFYDGLVFLAGGLGSIFVPYALGRLFRDNVTRLMLLGHIGSKIANLLPSVKRVGRSFEIDDTADGTQLFALLNVAPVFALSVGIVTYYASFVLPPVFAGLILLRA